MPARLPAVVMLIAGLSTVSGQGTELAETIRSANTEVLSDGQREQLHNMVARDIERRRLEAIRRENLAWSQVTSRDEWERFRDARLDALRDSLGDFPDPGTPLSPQITGRIEGDGYSIEKVVFESRPGLLVTANLYRPATSGETGTRPAILIAHSHHAPKTHRELQDMGVSWSRAGCLVLVPDHLGHGERRQHPFVTQEDHPSSFRVGRQDYYFRYNVGLQLHLIGDSLMGWMAWDLMRGVDLLLSNKEVDPERILLLGAVAGGGDPAAVTAALDPRIAMVAPFNFGGPQPDYSIPRNAEGEFYFFGVPHWEMTRSLRLGGRDGFAHWAIVGSVAPRGLIYSHEFAWNRPPDPIWPRLQQVFRWYDADDRLGVAAGRGTLRGSPPESSHCGNIGAVHRSKIYPYLASWFEMKPPAEVQQRQPASELDCLSAEAAERLEPTYKLADTISQIRLAAARRKLRSLDVEDRRTKLRDDWAALLGDVTPSGVVQAEHSETEESNGTLIERFILRLDHGVLVPVVLLRPAATVERRPPVVVAFARDGKASLLANRSEELGELLAGGVAICCPDLRGTGETSSGDYAGPGSSATALSCRDQVLGQTLIGSRLKDLRSVLAYLRTREDLRPRFTVWGDSLSKLNPPDRSEVFPHRVSNPNTYAEPTAGMQAIFCGLFEDDVAAIYARGTLASFRSLLSSPFLYLPHDAIIPGALTVGDLTDVAAALAPRPLRLDDPVDGLNRRVTGQQATDSLAPTLAAYRNLNAGEHLSLDGDQGPAAWLLDVLQMD